MLVFPRYLVEIGNRQVTDTRKSRPIRTELVYTTGSGKPFSAEQVKRLLVA